MINTGPIEDLHLRRRVSLSDIGPGKFKPLPPAIEEGSSLTAGPQSRPSSYATESKDENELSLSPRLNKSSDGSETDNFESVYGAQEGEAHIRSSNERYFWYRSRGPEMLSLPSEAAGPITSDQPNISNRLGNLRVHLYEGGIQNWVLGGTATKPRWLVANDGMIHPILDGYRLTLRAQRQPSWVKSGTHRKYAGEKKRLEVKWRDDGVTQKVKDKEVGDSDGYKSSRRT